MAQFVNYPDQFAAGSTFDGIVSTIDIGPTILDIAGIQQPYDMDGKAWASAMSKGGAGVRTWIFANPMPLADKPFWWFYFSICTMSVDATYNVSNILVQQPTGTGLLYATGAYLFCQSWWPCMWVFRNTICSARFLTDDDLVYGGLATFCPCFFKVAATAMAALEFYPRQQHDDAVLLLLSPYLCIMHLTEWPAIHKVDIVIVFGVVSLLI
jgi:hypothetical protein